MKTDTDTAQDRPEELDWRTILHEPMPPGALSLQREKARHDRWLFGLDYPQPTPHQKGYAV